MVDARVTITVKLGIVEPFGGEDPKTWSPHPDREVEKMFCEANRNGYVVYHHGGMYTLVSPGLEETFNFPGRVVASSGIWRTMIADLRRWLAHTAEAEPGGRRRW